MNFLHVINEHVSESTNISICKINIYLGLNVHVMHIFFVDRRGPVKYKFQGLSELDSLAVVNARDVGSCKNAFKILMFPDSRMFQAESPKEKVNDRSRQNSNCNV